MRPSIICALLLLKVSFGDACASGQFTETGRCCSLCPSGFGVEVKCGKEDTKCTPCPQGTFSSSEGLGPCLPCAKCPPSVPMVASCSATQDTQCECDNGYFFLSNYGLCAPCSKCNRGEGVIQECGPQGNTQCQICGLGTFSEEHLSTKPCQPCAQCSDSEVEIRACMPNSDTLCMDRKLHILSRPPLDGPDGTRDSPRWPDEGESSPSPGTPKFTLHDEGGSNNILAYVSVLAAVVLGLLLYVAYKCWRSCKQKRALSKARAAELGTSPEGEKLQSDSGVFLDSHSLQDNQPSKGTKRDSKQDNRLYINLPPCSYIDKRKKPNLNRRTSTLRRPKVPPPAPPVKKQDSAETAPPSSPGSDAPESPVSSGRPVYEEPEYDVPAIGDLDMESEFEFLRGEGSLVDGKNDDTSSEKGSHLSSKPSPASSLHSASFKMGESFEDGHEAEGEAEGEEECIYENDGFRPFRETPERQCSRDSNSSKTSVLSETGRTANPTSGGWRPAGNKFKIDLNGSPFSTKAEEASSPKSASTESTPDLSRTKKDQDESKASSSTKSSSKLKPVVRPKPHLAKASSAEKMDISTLRRQLRPTGQLKNGTKSKGEDAETASVISSEDSFSSQSTSDLSSIYSKGSRGDSDLEGCSLYRTTDPYEKVQESELSFPAGVEVEVVEKQESGWWYVRWGDAEGWAPTYYLEPIRQQDDMAGSESDGTPTKPGSLSKSNSLEKNEQRVQALNNINQNLKKVTPPIPSKPPGGLSKPTGLFGSRKQNSTKQQQVVRPQSVFISAPIRDGPSSLRRNESLNSTDHPRASPTVRRNASFGTVPHSLTPNNIALPNRNRSGTGSSESLGFSSQKNALPVSTVKPKPHIIHNNLREVYVSIADYHGDEETMGFPEGTSLEVLERNPNGWWYCKILDNGRPRKGWVPSNYLERKH